MAPLLRQSGSASAHLFSFILRSLPLPLVTGQARLESDVLDPQPGVELSNARINRFSDGFFPSTSHLWNSLPSSVFPASFNLPSFKRQVYHHLRGQMA